MARKVFETLFVDIADKVATITLNRPDKMNAYTGQMMLDIIAAFDLTDGDDSVSVVIVTGAGRAFCAGADLSAGGDRALEIGARTYGSVKSILDHRLDQRPKSSAAADGTVINHSNIRGRRYYQ